MPGGHIGAGLATVNVERWTRYLGGSVVGVPWVLFALCYALNPWFVVTRDALSDFGGPPAGAVAWVYNVGLVLIAVIIGLFSLGLVVTSRDKVQVCGGAFWFVAGLFLALIGIFHEGTYPHDFVSTWFFIQVALAIGTMGVGSFLTRDSMGGTVSIACAALMPLGDLLVAWPSAATVEIYEILIIDAWALFLLLRPLLAARRGGA